MYAQTACTLSGELTPSHGFTVGQPFIPYRAFRTGIFIPEAVMRDKNLSPRAKLAYGRLARYAGADGRCFPLMASLAYELGCSERTAQRAVDELVKAGYIMRKQRGFCQSNTYVFLWQENLQGAPRMAPACTSEMACSVSTSELTSIRESLKSEIEEQASTPLAVENSLLACIEETPRTQQIPAAPDHEAKARAILQAFKEDLKLDGVVGPTLVREVIGLVELPELPSALKLVDERIRLRRKRNPREYGRIGIGFVVTVLREDLNRHSSNQPVSPITSAKRDQEVSRASPIDTPPLSLPGIRKSLLEPRSAVSGFAKAGTILADLWFPGSAIKAEIQ